MSFPWSWLPKRLRKRERKSSPPFTPNVKTDRAPELVTKYEPARTETAKGEGTSAQRFPVYLDDNLSQENCISLNSVSDSRQPKYAIRDEDEDLRCIWNEDVVPKLIKKQLKTLSALGIIGFQLVRQGKTAATSVPTIAVEIAENSDKIEERHQALIQQVISSCVPPNQRSLLRMSIEKREILEFGVGNDRLPRLPDNNDFQISPGLGASIGIQGIDNNTATLGGYLMIEDAIYLVTSSHLMPFHRNPSVFNQQPEWLITHVSGQDSSLGKEQLQILSELLKKMTACCDACKMQAQQEGAPHLGSPPYRAATEKLQPLCPNLRNYLRIRCPPLILGELEHYSGDGFRESQYSQLTAAKMDWALIRVTGWPWDISNHIEQCSSDLEMPPRNGLGIGKRVKASGRITAMQKGVVSTTPHISLDRFDQAGNIMPYKEYPIMRQLDDDILGYKGDSGSFIIGEETNYVYGMLWGGDLDRIYFVPMLDMIDHIKESARVQRVALPGRPALRQTFSTAVGTENGIDVGRIAPKSKEKESSRKGQPVKIVASASPQARSKGLHEY